MNFNIIAYIIYGAMTTWTILYVGKVLHKNGRYYIFQMFKEEKFTDFINNALLAGYYLMNIGYVFMTLNNWEVINNCSDLIYNTCEKAGIIFILLGIMHFINIFSLKLYADMTKNTKEEIVVKNNF